MICKWHTLALITLCLLFYSLTGCKSNAAEMSAVEINPKQMHEEMGASLQDIVDKQVDEKGYPGVILYVDAPDIAFTWKGAAGKRSPEGMPITSDDPYLIANTSKMFTAVVIIELAVEQKIDLEASIGDYLSEGLVERVHIYNGRSYGREITIEQLLHHTSGLADVNSGVDIDGDGRPEFKDVVLTEPERTWTRDEVIAYTIGNAEPQFTPGTGWHYSDFNYQLLARIAEEVTGEDLPALYQRYIFDPLEMEQACVDQPGETATAEHTRPVAHPFFNGVDWLTLESREYDNWGAGGIIATAQEQADFLWALTDCKLFLEPAGHEVMCEWRVETDLPGRQYGCGFFVIDLAQLGLPGSGAIRGYAGRWNNFAYYWPERNVMLVGTLNRAEPENAYLEMLAEVMDTLNEVMGAAPDNR